MSPVISVLRAAARRSGPSEPERRGLQRAVNQDVIARSFGRNERPALTLPEFLPKYLL